MTGNGIETGMWKREKCTHVDDFACSAILVLASGHGAVSLPLTVLTSSMDADDGDYRNGGLETGSRNNF